MENGIYKGDCIELFKQIDNANVIITDPPYGIDYQSARQIDKNNWKPKIENDKTPFTDWIQIAYNKLQDGGRLICFYRWDVQKEFKTAIENAGFIIKSQIVWDKVIHGMGDLKGEFAPQHELMFYATKGRYEFKNKRPKSIYRVTRVNANNQLHPNEKPIKLLQQIIKDISIENELIIDPFGGSFSTYKAAKLEKRKCITFELSDYYYNLGIKNLAINTTYTQFFKYGNTI